MHDTVDTVDTVDTSLFSFSSVIMVISDDPGMKDIKNAAADCEAQKSNGSEQRRAPRENARHVNRQHVSYWRLDKGHDSGVHLSVGCIQQV